MSKLDCKKKFEVTPLLSRTMRLLLGRGAISMAAHRPPVFFMMKIVLTSSFLVALTLSQQVVLASSRDPERATPSVGMLAGGGIGASPLVRYLAATLQLSPAQTVAVQQAVQKHQRLTRTPELLAERLRTVLTEDEFERFEKLHNNADSAASLRELAVR